MKRLARTFVLVTLALLMVVSCAAAIAQDNPEHQPYYFFVKNELGYPVFVSVARLDKGTWDVFWEGIVAEKLLKFNFEPDVQYQIYCFNVRTHENHYFPLKWTKEQIEKNREAGRYPYITIRVVKEAPVRTL